MFHMLFHFGALARLLGILLPASHCVRTSHPSDLSSDRLQESFPALLHALTSSLGYVFSQLSYHSNLAFLGLLVVACFLASLSP